MAEQPPTVSNIKRHRGLAGAYTITCDVRYEDGTSYSCGFASQKPNDDGAPIVAISPSGVQVFVQRPVLDDLGNRLDEDWVRRYFARRIPHGV